MKGKIGFRIIGKRDEPSAILHGGGLDREETRTMSILKTAIIVNLFGTLSLLSGAQAPSKAPQTASANALSPPVASAPAAAAPGAPLVVPSAVLAPGLDAVQYTLNTVKTDKWKRGSVRDEAGADIGSIVSDIQVKLPPLLKDADGAPATASKMIPVARNVDALYDVLLRVVEAARMAAPDDQANALRQALGTLSTSRLAFYDKMLAATTAQEKATDDLRITVQKQAAFKCPVPPPVKPCPTPAAPKRAAKKPSAGTPQGTPPAATTPPKKNP